MSSSADLPAADSSLRLRNSGAVAAGVVNPESVPSVEKPSADDRLNNTNNTNVNSLQNDNERDDDVSKSNKTYGRTPDGTGNTSLPTSLSFSFSLSLSCFLLTRLWPSLGYRRRN